MFGGNPIESWEGATVIYSYAGSVGVDILFWISVALCVGTIIVSIVSENRAEAQATRLLKERDK